MATKAKTTPAAKTKTAAKDTLTIFRSDALEVLELCGIKSSKNETNAGIAARFDKDIIEAFESIDEETEVDPAAERLMKSITKAVEGELTIEVADDADDLEDEDGEDDGQAEEEEEAEDEEPTPKASTGKGAKPPTKKSTTAEEGPGRGRQKGDKKVGILQTIVRLLVTAGDKKRPIPKMGDGGIHEMLCRKFPDRDKNGMKNTVNMQVPTGLKSEKNITVESNDKGYWIVKTPAIEQYLDTGSMKERKPPAPPAKKAAPKEEPKAAVKDKATATSVKGGSNKEIAKPATAAAKSSSTSAKKPAKK